ncbi:MAG TPA: hypothetical protein VHQ94_21765 [Pyrinomonadaceae bacterium]|jgi:hypothetical protein|nr:hypothetical protein [Pyrinomonadaceae bacterium]
MDINKLAGWCLILLGVANVVREVVILTRENGSPGAIYALVTALLITLGAVFLIRKPIPQRRKAKD